MRLPAFAYEAPSTIDEAVAIKSEAPPEGAYVAGGTDLYPNMKRRHQEPPIVVALHRIEALRGIESQPDGALSIGAMTTLTEVAEHPVVIEACPALATTMRLISTPILQNMGTLGGNILLDTRCNYYDQSYEWRRSIDFCMKKDGDVCWVAPSSPRCWAVQSSDSVPLLIALDAVAELAGPEGRRTIPVAALFNDDGIVYLSKHRDELLTRIIIPRAGTRRATYRKVRRRGAFDFPVLGVGASITLDDDDRVSKVRIVLGGVGSAPRVVSEAADAIVGGRLDEGAIGAASEAAWRSARPLDNTDFTLSWRKEMIRPTVARALGDLVASS